MSEAREPKQGESIATAPGITPYPDTNAPLQGIDLQALTLQAGAITVNQRKKNRGDPGWEKSPRLEKVRPV